MWTVNIDDGLFLNENWWGVPFGLGSLVLQSCIEGHFTSLINVFSVE